MCGIFGTFGTADDGRVDRGLDLISHRGPDGRGKIKFGEVVHGHVRLSLLDLSAAGAQPWQTSSGVLTFVGELWNHVELRTRLKEEGAVFRSSTDTEVLAELLSRTGVDATVPLLDGMFAFCWSDDRGGSWLVRDRFGKIPLHVLRRGSRFEWSSERKAWGRDGGLSVDLPPGHVLNLETGKMWRWGGVEDHFVDSSSVVDEAAAAVKIGVAKRMVADAPLCCLISGGLDSSLILRLALDVRKDVVGYHAYLDPRSEDRDAARRLCSELGVRLVEVRVPPPTKASLSKALATVEVETKVQAELAAMCLPLAERIAADGFKACLSGEAADELFGGYGNSVCKAAAGRRFGSGMSDLDWRVHRRELLAGMPTGNFTRCNKAFMAHGVECRLPFMERRLVELALSCGLKECPPDKELLKLVAIKVLPSWIVRRQKETFQGGAGMSAAASASIGDVGAFVRQEVKRLWKR